MSPADRLELTDPRAMRALAHPARLAILELLQANGTANATECGREVGSSPQAASYHLRALAKWGLVVPAASADGREARWELAARSIMLGMGDDSPQFRTAARALSRRVLERDDRLLETYLDVEDEEPREWREAATFSRRSIFVTAEEAREFTKRYHALLDEYAHRDAADRPEGGRRMHVIFRAVPNVESRKRRRNSK